MHKFVTFIERTQGRAFIFNMHIQNSIFLTYVFKSVYFQNTCGMKFLQFSICTKQGTIIFSVALQNIRAGVADPLMHQTI
jgi:hypothetical protein